MRDNIIDFEDARDRETGLKRVNRKERKYRFGRFYRVCLILLLIGAVVLAYFIYEKTKVYSTYQITSSVKRTPVEGAKVLDFGGTILSYSKDGANAMDETGKLLWNQTFDMQNPMISECEDAVAFADYGGSKIYFQNKANETGVISTDMPIRKISVAAKGYVAAVLEDVDVTWIYLYDLNGNAISYFRTTMEKSGYPVDVDISPDGKMVAVSYYYMDCNDIKSSVAFFNFGPVGQNNVDNYVSGFNYTDTLVPIVRFLDDENSISVSSSRLSIYSGAQKPVSISDMFINDEIQSVYYDNDVVAIVYLNKSEGDKYRLEVYNLKGEKLSERKFNFDYSDVTFGNGNVVLYGDKNIYISTYSGATKYEGIYEEPIILTIPTVVRNKYIVVTEDSIDTIELK